MDAGLDLRKPGEQTDGASLGSRRQTRALDEGRNVGQSPMRMMSVTGMLVRVIVILVESVLAVILLRIVLVPVLAAPTRDMVARRSIGPLHDAELGGGDAATVDPIGHDRDAVEPKRRDDVAQPVEREAGIEERTEHHIA